MRTKTDIHYAVPFGFSATIPKGTPVIPANNLPMTGRYWAEPWPNMTEQEESWNRNYGFLIETDEVE
jgi:hypothetical protein